MAAISLFWNNNGRHDIVRELSIYTCSPSSLFIGISLQDTTYNTRDMFCLSMLVFAIWHHRSKKIQHWEGRREESTTFCRNMGAARDVPN